MLRLHYNLRIFCSNLDIFGSRQMEEFALFSKQTNDTKKDVKDSVFSVELICRGLSKKVTCLRGRVAEWPSGRN